MTLQSIDKIRSLDRAGRISFAVGELTASAHTFLNSAKAIVALDGSTKDLEAALVKAIGNDKAKNSLKNAGQAVAVWDTVVALEHADEAWFDRHTYGEFVALNRAIKKAVGDGLKGASHLAAEGVFKMSCSKAHTWCEVFCDPAPKAPAKPAKPAEAVAEPTVSAPVTPEVAPATPAAEAPTPTPATATPTPATPAEPTTPSASAKKTEKAPTADSVNKLIEAAEAALLKLIDSGDEVAATKAIARTLAMKLAADAASAAKWPATTSAKQEVKAA